ncbi:MAG: helix-turn-helix transcriptional regulator [Raoultibacter sp.]
MSDLQKYLHKQLDDPAFAAAWERAYPEYEIMKLLAQARNEQGLSQAELAQRCGLKQSNISRLETGASSPTLKTLEQLASGLGRKLEIRFV